MKYIDADRLYAEIEKHYDEYRLKFNTIGDPYYLGVADGLDVAQRVIDSLQQEQPCEELEEAAENYIAPIENDEGLDYINFNGRDIKDAFIAGAKWQKGQKPEVEICPHSIKSKSYKEITGDETR